MKINKLEKQTIALSIEKRRVLPCARPSCILVEDLHDVLRTDLGMMTIIIRLETGKYNKGATSF
jgi:hypothetical protein